MMTWLTWSNLYIALAFLSALMWLAAASIRLPKTAWFEAGAGGAHLRWLPIQWHWTPDYLVAGGHAALPA